MSGGTTSVKDSLKGLYLPRAESANICQVFELLEEVVLRGGLLRHPNIQYRPDSHKSDGVHASIKCRVDLFQQSAQRLFELAEPIWRAATFWSRYQCWGSMVVLGVPHHDLEAALSTNLALQERVRLGEVNLGSRCFVKAAIRLLALASRRVVGFRVAAIAVDVEVGSRVNRFHEA